MAAKNKPAKTTTAAGRAESRARRESGVTKSGLPSQRKGKGTNRVKGTKKLATSQKSADEAAADVGVGREEPLTPKVDPTLDVRPRLGETEETSTGLSDVQPDVGAAGLTAEEMIARGFALDPETGYGADDTGGDFLFVGGRGNRRTPAAGGPEYVAGLEGTARRQRVRRRAQAAQTVRDTPVNLDEAARQQAIITADTKDTILGPASVAPRVRTIDPGGSTPVPVRDDSGKITARLATRTRDVQPAAVSRTDTRVRQEAKEAASALELAETISQIDEKAGELTPVIGEYERPIEGSYTDAGQGVGGAVNYDEEADYDPATGELRTETVRVRRQPNRSEIVAMSGSVSGLTGRQRSYFRGTQSRTAKAERRTRIPSNVVGSPIISPQFRAKVEALKQAADKKRIEAGETGKIDIDTGDIVYTDESGAEVTRRPVQVEGGERLVDVASAQGARDLLARISGYKNRRTQPDPYARTRSKESEMFITDEDITDASGIDMPGATHSDLVQAYIMKKADPVEQERRRKQIEKLADEGTSVRKLDERTTVRAIDPVTGRPATAAGGGDVERAQPMSLRDEILRNWRPRQTQIKRAARATGRTADETIDQTIRTWAIQKATEKAWEQTMAGETSAPSQAAMKFRVQPGISPADIPLGRTGAAAVPDDYKKGSKRYGVTTMARLRATSPRLASALSRTPGDTGAIQTTVLDPEELARFNAENPSAVATEETSDQASADVSARQEAIEAQLARAPEVQARAAGRAAKTVTINGQTYTGKVGDLPVVGTNEYQPTQDRSPDRLAPNTQRVTFKVPSGEITRSVAFNPIPSYDVTSKDLAPGVMPAPAPSTPGASVDFAASNVVRGRGPTATGAWFDPTSRPATPQNIMRAAMRPYREAGLATARAVSRERTRAELAARPARVYEAPAMLPDDHPERVAALAEYAALPTAQEIEAASKARTREMFPGMEESTNPTTMGEKAPSGPSNPAETWGALRRAGNPLTSAMGGAQFNR